MSRDGRIEIILCGDVMTGRGIDQILERPSEAGLHESYVKSAVDYVRLAEAANGPIPRNVDPAYPWGDALGDMAGTGESVRIVNLETSITRSADFEPKGINYRMHPANIGCIGAGGVDCCVLANNHVLDWGESGLIETLETLEQARIGFTGAGRDAAQASRPWMKDIPGGGRVLVFGFGCPSSGIGEHWAASAERPGVNLLEELSAESAERAIELMGHWRRPGDLIVVSIHWGGNWGYDIPASQIDFAHRLIEAGMADAVHGHSSHHAKAIEIYRGKPILYGCGDFINDYEGIQGYERYRGDLAVLYTARFNLEDDRMEELRLTLFRMRKFRLEHAGEADLSWLEDRLDCECKRFGCNMRRLERHALYVVGGR